MRAGLLHSILQVQTSTEMQLALVILILPVLSFIVLYFLGKILPRKGDLIATTIMGFAFLLSLVLFFYVFREEENHFVSLNWFTINSISNPIDFKISMLLNPVAACMLVIVTMISFLVHLYSIEYMEGKRNYLRYFPYLALFTFAMIGLILSDNLLLTFMFWELVGFASYLLIGFWFEKESAAKAAKKAFILNRVGDAGFLAGLMIVYTHFHTFDLSEIKTLHAGIVGYQPWLVLAGLGFFCGSIGKSAQFPLLTWLPDAMEGPTPVSALIHAATMVAAGVYLLFKVFFLLAPPVLLTIAVIGAITALIGAYAALTQNDIKKVLAYSTISQLGYMMIGMGTGSYDTALFHLVTHAFFKACLFLSAGAVIHGMHHVYKHLFEEGHYIDFNTLDMRLMGGFRHKMPVTFYAYTVSCLSLVGLPFFSGFLSKDAILIRAAEWASVQGSVIAYLIPAAGILTVFMTAFYMGRQLFLIFFNNFRLGQIHETADVIFSHLKDVTWKIKFPLVFLATLSLWPFFSVNPFEGYDGWFLTEVQTDSPGSSPGIHIFIPLLSVVLAIGGLLLAWFMYGRKPVVTTGTGEMTYSIWYLLSKNNLYLDRIQARLFKYPTILLAGITEKTDRKYIDGILHFTAIANVVLAHILAWADRYIVDGLVNSSATLSAYIGTKTRKMQGGRIQDYLSLLVIVVLILLWVIII